MILNCIELLGLCLILFTVFSKLITLALNIIQLPFAAISRTAVYCILFFRTFLLALFFSVCVWIAEQNNLPTLPFLIVFSFVLYGEIIAPYSNNDIDSSAQTYIALSSVVSVIIFLLLYFFKFFPFIKIPLLFFSALSWVLNLPYIGTFLNFILPFLSFVTCVFAILNTVLICIAFIGSLLGEVNSKKNNT